MFLAQKAMVKAAPAVLTQRFDAATKSPYVGLTASDRMLVVTDGFFSYEGARSTVTNAFLPGSSKYFEFVLNQTLEGLHIGICRASVSMTTVVSSGLTGTAVFKATAAAGVFYRDGSLVSNTGVTGCASGDRFLVSMTSGGDLEVFKNGTYIGAGSISSMAGSGDVHAYVAIAGGVAGVAGTVNFGHTSFTQSSGGGAAWG